jgi:transposase
VETFFLAAKGSLMAKRPTYPPEFRRRIVQLVRSGRTLNSVAIEFQVARQSVVNWVKQDDLDVGRRTDGVTTDERKELTQLRKRVRDLEEEKVILKKAAAWFARETRSIPERSSDS